jgi:hypothetical protein
MTGTTTALLTTREAVAYLRTHGHPRLTVQALWHHRSRARKARAARKTGPHLFPEPLKLDGRTQLWRPESLDAWKPLGRGHRTRTDRKEQS